MSTMIERVARAILAESYRIGNTHGDFDALSPEVQGVFKSFARAAITEIRSSAEEFGKFCYDRNDEAWWIDSFSENALDAYLDAALKEEA
ncbi:hypothetical protein HJB67_13245 [Rhizobium lentis]|uniref:hypothetical protein n=1 Tax=Rhizobium lentis TaxID=1138194 RepID=UPI001C83EB07|nr:hypothetical protein [Rhizobium lentis]MBX5010920.1 hypothetical protein [Rhizobium lentis]